MNDFTEDLKYILTEMCNRVGVKYEDIDFKKDRWFMDYSWTQSEEDDFKIWMNRQLYEHKNLRGIMSLPIKNKKIIQKTVDWFLFMYGWRYK
jgi:hypothetical protein